MGRTHIFSLGLVALAATFAACSASTDGGAEFGDGDDGSNNSGGAGGGTTAGTGASGVTDGDFDGDVTVGNGGSSSSGNPACITPADVDDDLDGFTEEQGDCNDCDPNVSPASIEVIVTDGGSGGAGGASGAGGAAAQAADEDCDNMVDNVAPPCDTGLTINSVDAMDAARAVDLCQLATGPKWGVISANYVRANGTVTASNASVGLLDNFGPNVTPQGGSNMLALSSGKARRPADAGACGTYSCFTSGVGTAPPGFPQDSSGCSIGTNINDDVGFEVKIRSPKNATGYSFDFKFYSFEYPEFVCTTWNDQFISLVSPPPMGALDGNISFDANNNPVSVNVAFFDVCAGCLLGTAELAGNGFDVWDDAGATSWLKTTAPITGGNEVTIRWAIWDTGDQSWDSTALVDNFQWIATGGTPAVGTEPIPDPK